MLRRILLAASCCLGTPGLSEAADFFRDKVAPLLEARCLGCHDAGKKRGGLDLSTRSSAMAGGESGPAFVPGAAAKSRLVQMIAGAKPLMPRTGAKLTTGEVALVRRWIDAGAAWPEAVKLGAKGTAGEETWWSLRALVRPPIPMVKGGRGRTPIDAFILAGLHANGLRPAPEADRATLIRRLSFDLLGLPPAPAEVDAFLGDRRPDAYEWLVDRLLASPAYGERWGRHWLDLAHYGDTHGYDKDKRRDFAWPYRDWVIRALNADLPYSEFIRQQIAGDVLRPGDPDGVVATGFVVAGPWDFVGNVELREGTVDKEKTRLTDRDDMVSTTLGTFVSLTVGCARCHDHKFDPIPQKDYYRLQAVFAGVERGNRPLQTPEVVENRARLLAERDRFSAERSAVAKKIEALTSPELARLESDLARARAELARIAPPAGPASPSNGYHSDIVPRADAVKWVQIDLGAVTSIDEVRLFPARPTDFRDSPGFGFPLRFRVEIGDEPDLGKPRLFADHTRDDFANPGDNPYRISSVDKKGRYLRVTATRLWKRLDDYVFALAEVQVISAGKNVAKGKPVSALDSIEAGRWSRRFLVDDFDSRLRLPDLSDVKSARAFEQRLALAEQVRAKEQERSRLADTLVPASLRQQRARIDARLAAVNASLAANTGGPMVYAIQPIPPRPIWVLHRGDVEQHKQLVSAGGLACVPGPVADFKIAGPDEGARRAALAEWIADRRNGLTWRSIVNRVWHYHFGRGIVDTPSDFGRNGSRPTHPELLDWLAVEFRDGSGGEGSLKKLHRLIVTSSVYRQSSRHDEAAARVDSDNRYLWRMNRRRLDAESLRDAVLSVSGQLDRHMGGSGYEPFRFKDDHSPIYDHDDLKKILDPATYRRTVYRFTVRSVPNPFLDCMDCPDPSLHTPVRNATLTALQALALLNNPFMVRQASHFADRLKTMSADVEVQVEQGYRLAFGRSPAEEEKTAVVAYARKHGLAKACRVLFNASEFVFVD
jgi:hypothetical protein